MSKRRIGNALSTRDLFQFFIALVQAQTRQECGCTTLKRAPHKGLAIALVGRIRDVILFDGNACTIVLTKNGANGIGSSLFGGEHMHALVGTFLCRFHVAEVGDQISILLQNQHNAVVELKARQIVLVELVGNNGGIKAVFTQQCLKILQI